jgi:hypothetical protein
VCIHLEHKGGDINQFTILSDVKHDSGALFRHMVNLR